MKDFFRQIYHTILKFLPTKLVINIENLLVYKRFFKKNRLEYYGEKIQYLKLYGNLEKYTNYVDKYFVRDYIEKKIGKEYLIPLIGVYNKPEEINYSELPNQFVLKLNHGSGYNLIVKNKEEIDINKTNKRLNKWLKEDYYKIKKENQYKNINKKIICEKYIKDINGELKDYKFFCFDGKPEFFKVDFDRFKNHKANFYDMDCNFIDMQEFGCDNYEGKFDKPKNFSKMVEIATKLSEDFQAIRVDLYNIDEKIYFGELTFTHAGGRHPFLPLEKDKEIAERLKI